MIKKDLMSNIKYKKLSLNAKKPERALASAGYDLFSTHVLTINPGCMGKIQTGIAVELSEQSVGLLKDRSSLGSKGIRVTAGVIDSDYRGEIIVCIYNGSKQYFTVQLGDKIAQMLILPILTPELILTSELTDTKRGSDGFGSTDASIK
jgi:dUTP pyrophosphatase